MVDTDPNLTCETPKKVMDDTMVNGQDDEEY